MMRLTTLIFDRTIESAQGYLLLGMPAQALRELEAVGRAGAESADWHRLRGEALRSLYEHADALHAFEQADQLEPGDLATLLGIAWCEKRTDHLQGAIATMLRAHRVSPKEPIVHYNLACYYTLAGDKNKALSWLGRALRLSPDLRTLISEERDFDGLRNDADFQFVIAGAPGARVT